MLLEICCFRGDPVVLGSKNLMRKRDYLRNIKWHRFCYTVSSAILSDVGVDLLQVWSVRYSPGGPNNERTRLGASIMLGINGVPPIVSLLCFRVNLTANQRGDHERMRCRYHLIIKVSAAVSKIVAVTASSKGRFAAQLRKNLLMFYQFLTAVVFYMCLQDFMTDHSGSLVQK